jgi:hypothetical protein
MSSEPPAPESTSNPEETIRFRPGKKRKLYRKREDASPPATEAPTAEPRDGQADNNEDEEDGRASAAAALRLRNARKPRSGGVGFTATGTKADSSADRSSSNVLVASHSAQDGEVAVAGGITNRFTHQTGLVSSLNDKHMYVFLFRRVLPLPCRLVRRLII